MMLLLLPQSQFEMKDIRSLCYFFSLEVTSLCRGYLVSQRKLAIDLLNCLSDTRTVETSMKLHIMLRSTDGEPLSDLTRY